MRSWQLLVIAVLVPVPLTGTQKPPAPTRGGTRREWSGCCPPPHVTACLDEKLRCGRGHGHRCEVLLNSRHAPWSIAPVEGLGT